MLGQQDEQYDIKNIDFVIWSPTLRCYRKNNCLIVNPSYVESKKIEDKEWSTKLIKDHFILYGYFIFFILLCNDLVKSINFAFCSQETDRCIWLQKCFWTCSKRDMEKKMFGLCIYSSLQGFQKTHFFGIAKWGFKIRILKKITLTLHASLLAKMEVYLSTEHILYYWWK